MTAPAAKAAAPPTPEAEKPSFKSTWTQLFLPKPTFTDKNIPNDLAGKVYLVTGATGAMGKDLARVLYARNAKVYLACRFVENAAEVAAEIKKAAPKSRGELTYVHLDLADLETVKACAAAFLGRETRLHVLFNNAGVMTVPTKPMPRRQRGVELALGINCVGSFLLTELLTLVLVATARAEAATAPGSVRVVWTSSFGLAQYSPAERGIDMDNLDYQKKAEDGQTRCGISKCGTRLLAVEYGRRHRKEGIVSTAVNPGVRDGLKMMGSKVMNGVYTQLYAAFSAEVTKLDLTRNWIIPWGRVASIRSDLNKAVIPREAGGNENALEFWEWNEAQVAQFL